jgi:hypothetical protein
VGLVKAKLDRLGHVSTEGGPLLIADREGALSWKGVFGEGNDDYQRVCDRLNVHRNAPGFEIDLRGQAAIVWDMPIGTAEIWRVAGESLVISRSWLELGSSQARFLASLPAKNPIPLGTLRLNTQWLVIVWATESGEEIAKVTPSDGAPMDLSVDNAGIVVALPPGGYTCYHDEVSHGSATARRCLIVADQAGMTIS